MCKMQSVYVHNIDPFLVRFPANWPIDGIRWYGVCYLISFVLSYFLLNFYSKAKKSCLTFEDNASFLTYAVLGVILGGRVGYMFLYDFTNLVSNPISIFQIWNGGMSSHGGFVGVALAVFMFCRAKNIKFLNLTDIVVTIAPLGLFIGRIGNFINCELWGRVTDVWFGVIFDKNVYYLAIPRHPSQIYEGVLEGLLIFVYMQLRFWRSSASESSGRLTGEFCILYSFARIFCEQFREPDASLIFNLTRGQFYSIFLILVGVVILFVSSKRKNS